MILCDYSKFRFKNPIVIEKITEIIEDPFLNEINIKLKLLEPEITKKEYDALFDIEGNINNKKLAYLCKKYKINYYKINKIKKDYLLNKLNDKKLIEMIQQEKRLNLIVDNAKIHKAEVTRIVADILNINLVYLPVYSPFLSTIEQVWADVKKEMYTCEFDSLDELVNEFNDLFYEKVDNTSYYENWTLKFFDRIFW